MSKRRILIGTLAIVVVLAAAGAVTYTLHDRAQMYPGLSLPSAVVCPGPNDGTTGQGAPAIRPRNDCTPSFTQQDVRDYLARLVSLGSIHVIGQPSVTRVVFLTIRELGSASGDSEWGANYSADMVVCYAGLKGTFSVYDPFGGASPHTGTAFILFDGHTGNQLVSGLASPLG